MGLYRTAHISTEVLPGTLGTGCYSENKEGVIEEFQRREWHGQFCVLERSLAAVGRENNGGRIVIDQAEGIILN